MSSRAAWRIGQSIIRCVALVSRASAPFGILFLLYTVALVWTNSTVAPEQQVAPFFDPLRSARAALSGRLPGVAPASDVLWWGNFAVIGAVVVVGFWAVASALNNEGVVRWHHWWSPKFGTVLQGLSLVISGVPLGLVLVGPVALNWILRTRFLQPMPPAPRDSTFPRRGLATLVGHRQPKSGVVLGLASMGRVVYADKETNTLALGGPRSGKTAAVVIPSVQGWAGPCVATSTKWDVFNAVAARRFQLGPVYVFDCGREDHDLPDWALPLRWSPLLGCRSEQLANDRAQTMCLAALAKTARADNAAFFAGRAQTFLGPCLHAAALHGLTVRQVIEWAQEWDADIPLDILRRHESRSAARMLQSIMVADERFRTAVQQTVLDALSSYRDKVLKAADEASESTWNPDAFLETRATLFVRSPIDEGSEIYVPVIAGILADIYGSARRASDRRPSDPPQLLLALDEVANIAPITNLPALMTEALGRGVTTLLGVQDWAQVEQRWGNDAAAIWTASHNKVVSRGISNSKTLADLERLGGTKHVANLSNSDTGPQGSASTSRGWQEKPRFSAAEIHHLSRNQALVFTVGAVRKLRAAHYYRHNPFKSWAQAPEAIAE